MNSSIFNAISMQKQHEFSKTQSIKENSRLEQGNNDNFDMEI